MKCLNLASTYLFALSPGQNVMRRDAAPPFNSNKADIVLRSSDDIYFQVHRCMLAYASPFFDSMFDLPRSQGPSLDDEKYQSLVVIPVTENSRVLDMLLRFCYPTLVDDPDINNLSDLESVLEAAVKYGMEGVELRVRRTLLESSMTTKEPLHALTIAYRFRYEQEVRATAKCFLQQPVLPEDSTTLKYINEDDRQNLRAYRAKCTQAVLALGNSLSWFQENESYAFFRWWTNCCACTQRADARFLMHGTYARAWLAEYIEETLVILQETPCASAVYKRARTALERAAGCASCRRNSELHLSDFLKKFADAVNEVVAGIPLGIEL